MFDTSDEAANRSRRLQVSTPLWFNCVTSLLLELFFVFF